MSDDCIAVFTCEGPSRIIRQRGSRAWKLGKDRARKCNYLICIQHREKKHSDCSEASEPHGAVFLVGKISDVIPDLEESDRWLICISEYALHTVMNAWPGHRNPVWYPPLEEIGFDPGALEFKLIPAK
jgi:KaiC/GvpD/RAD55 family RecA-like ATPase